jgi:hypothetical protein
MVIGSFSLAMVVFGIGRVVPIAARRPIQFFAVGVAVVLELMKLRPLSLQRQVPQLWGHQKGAVAAAFRYGLRLGVGPATILTSWLWWAGVIVAGLDSVATVVICALSFPLGRLIPLVVLAHQSPNGLAMSLRMRRVEALREPMRFTTIGVAGVAFAGLLVRTLARLG